MSERGYRQAKEQIAQLEAELAEFQASSRELEKELEMELEESELRHKNLTNQVESLTDQVNDWKNRHLELQKEYSANQASLLKQISSLKEKHGFANDRLRDIEMTNDDMERHERITKTSLEELENKYHNSLEQIAMLESEVVTKDDLQVDLQRSKDDLRDTKEELAVAQTKIDALMREKEKLEMSNQQMHHRLSTTHATPTMKTPFRITSDPYAATTNIYATAPSPSSSDSPPLPQSTNPNPNPNPNPSNLHFQRMSSSKSLRKIHGMLDQMRNLEYRVAHFKSSLPKPSSPNSLHSRSNSTTASPTGSPRVSKPYMPDTLTASTANDSPNNNSQLPVASLRRSSSILDRPLLHDSAKQSPPAFTTALRNSYISDHHKSQLESIEGSPSTNKTRDTNIRKKAPPRMMNLSKRNSVSTVVQSYDQMINSSEKINEKHSNGLVPPPPEGDASEKNTLGSSNRPGSAFSALHKRTSIGHGRFV